MFLLPIFVEWYHQVFQIVKPLFISVSYLYIDNYIKIHRYDVPIFLYHLSACSVQSLEEYDGPRAPLLRQVSLDEERREDCLGHWRGPELQGEEEEKGVRLFRALLLQHLRLEELRPPPCIVAPARPDQRLVQS